MITTYNATTRTPCFFTRGAARLNPDQNIYMHQAARMTSSAPSYFNPAVLGKHEYVDGGIFANNPSLHALLQVGKNTNFQNINLVSLGTGSHRPLTANRYQDYGLFHWFRKKSVIFESTSDAAHKHVKDILPVGNYTRIQTNLKKEISLDGVDKANIQRLKKAGNECIKENNDLINKVCDSLLKSHSNNFSNSPIKRFTK